MSYNNLGPYSLQQDDTSYQLVTAMTYLELVLVRLQKYNSTM